MDTVPEADFQCHLDRYQSRALVEPVLVTRNGQDRLVLLSADEYRRLNRLDRESLGVDDLTTEALTAIANSQVPMHYACLDKELSLARPRLAANPRPTTGKHSYGVIPPKLFRQAIDGILATAGHRGRLTTNR